MSTKINFFDGAESSTTPTVGNVSASELVKYANDAAYEAANAGAPQEGNIYYNTTLDLIRYYSNAAWRTLVDTNSNQTLDNKIIDFSTGGTNTIVADAIDIDYNNTTSGLTATNTQAAIDEVEGRLDTAESDINTLQSDVTTLQSDVNTLQSDVSTLQSDVSGLQTDVTNLQSLSGRPDGSTHLGTFTGTTISDNTDIKNALQQLETEVETKIDSSEKGAVNGVATLDAGGKVPASQLPNTVMEFKGSFDPATATFTDASGNAGDVWLATAAGSYNAGSGSITYAIGDWAVHNGTIFEKSLNSNAVTSVNGFQGTVVLDLDDINDVIETSTQARDVLRRNTGNTAWENYNLDSTANDAASGANQTLSSVTASVIRLTNAGLTSIDMIPAGYSGQKFILINRTGVTVNVNHNTGATAANRIYTGTGAMLELLDDSALWLEYDSTEQRWQITGGSGAGFGTVSGPGSSTDNAIVRWDGTTGDTAQNSGVTIDDSNNMLSTGNITTSGNLVTTGSGKVNSAGGYTDGTNTTTTPTLMSVRNINSSVSDEDSLRYDSTTSTWVPRIGENARLGILSGSNKDFAIDTGSWTTYADAAATQPVDGTGGSPNVTLSRTTTSGEVLNGLASLKLSKDSANRQGQGYSLDMSIPEKFRGQPVKIQFSLKASANFDFGTPFDYADPSDLTVYFYDVTNSNLIQPYPYTFIEPRIFEGFFQIPTSCTSGRLILHVTTTNALAWDVSIDDIDIILASNVDVNDDSDWEDYTPSFTGFGSVVTHNLDFRKDGGDLLIRGTFLTGTSTATEARVSLPTGLKTPSNLPTLSSVGSYITSSTATSHGGRVLIEPSITYVTFTQSGVYGSTNLSGLSKANGNGTNGDNATITIEARIPIDGWTSGNKTAASANLNAPAVFTGTQTSQAVTANVTNISFTAVKDTVSGWSTNIYTVKTPGDYLISSTFVNSVSNTGVFYKNGSSFANMSSTTTGGLASTGSVVMSDLKVGDTISVRSTGTGTVTSGNLSINKIETSGRVYSTRTAYIKDVKASGTNGGTFTSGAYQTRTLNTLEGDTSFVSLSSNQFTLQPGSYKIEAYAPAYAVAAHKIKLRNTTDSTDTIIGKSTYSDSPNLSSTDSSLIGLFNISTSKTFEIQHRCTTTKATDGFGVASTFGDSEIYTVVKIEKIL